MMLTFKNAELFRKYMSIQTGICKESINKTAENIKKGHYKIDFKSNPINPVASGNVFQSPIPNSVNS